MLTELKFVKGAVAKNSDQPYMTHFAIKDGTVRSYNGMITLCTPIAFDIDCNPKADLLIKAISNCKETVALSMTDTGRLKVQSGKFKAFIECFSETTPEMKPEGILVDIDGLALIKAFNLLYKFICDDNNRPWTTGLLLRNGSAFATNNVCILEHWLGYAPEIPINIPKAAIREILRINEIPTHIQIGKSSITFHYSENRWIKSNLLENNWPDLNSMLNKDSNPIPIDPEIFNGLSILKPFTNNMGAIYITPGMLSTSSDLTTSANYEIPSINFNGIFNVDMLSLLNNTATKIDWTTSPCLFFGDLLRGAIVGMRR